MTDVAPPAAVDALQLLRDAVKRSTIAQAARELGVSRPAVSLLLAGKYKGRTDRMLARIVARFGSGFVQCPHLQAALAVPDCHSWRTRPMPRSAPDALRHWTACRTCPIGGGIQALAKQKRLPAELQAPAQPVPAQPPQET